MPEKLSTVTYLGLQECHKRIPYPLVVDPRGSSVAFSPFKYCLSTYEFNRMIIDCWMDAKMHSFFDHLRAHWLVFGKHNFDYLAKFFRLPKEEIEGWFDILLQAGIVKAEQECIHKDGIRSAI